MNNITIKNTIFVAMNKWIYFYLLSFIVHFPITAQEKAGCKIQQEADFRELLNQNTYTGNTMNLASVACLFLRRPYVGHTLEVNTEEQLVVNLKEMDCMTLIENCIALQRIIARDSADFDHFYKELQYIRYREGVINGYQSRLHYTSDWIRDNEKKGILVNCTKELGGEIFPVNVSFMSTHPGSYKQLTLNPGLTDTLRIIEQSINQDLWYYIPKEEIRTKENIIREGDIICFTTSTKGLDISHLGIAHKENGITTFIHASSAAKKVIINPESISAYCNKIRSNTGIVVLKLLEQQP